MPPRDSNSPAEAQPHNIHPDTTRFAEILFAEATAAGVERPVFELRVVDWFRDPGFRDGGTNAGYFDDPSKLAEAAAALDRREARAVYVSLAPVKAELLARSANRISARCKHTANDSDAVHRILFLVDVDPRRPAGISSSDAEHDAALAKIQEIRGFLRERGWPEAIVGDSGNGGHLLYLIDLLNEDESRNLVENVLRALAEQFDDETVAIDTSVSNASRISKVYGTKARKGDSLPERPHRVSRLLEVPDSMSPVPSELLRKLAEDAPRPKPDGGLLNPGRRAQPSFDLDAFFEKHRLDVASLKTGTRGEDLFVLRTCPFDPAHTGDGGGGGSAVVTREPGGTLGFLCHHNSCASHDWRQLRELLEPGCYERGLAGRTTRNRREEPAVIAADRARQEGLLPFELVEAYRRAVERTTRATGSGGEPMPATEAARALALVEGADEDAVVRVLAGDEQDLRDAFRSGGGDTSGFLSPPVAGAGLLFELEGELVPVTWACSERKSADTGTLTTPLFLDRLSLQSSSRRASASKKLAKAHGFEPTEELVQLIDEMLLGFGNLDADTRAATTGEEEGGDLEALVSHLSELGLEYFHTPGGLDAECFAIVPVEGHREVWSLSSRGFKHWLRRANHQRFGRVLSDTAAQSVVGLLCGYAMYDGAEHEVFVRRGKANGKIYIDLARLDWATVEIDSHGWRVVDPLECGVHFVRKSGMLELPMPVAGGRVDELRDVMNVADEESWTITKGFLLSAFHPDGPYLGLSVFGEQGSGKSSFARNARRTIDPSNRDVRRNITNEPDLAIAAASSLILAVDNLSDLSPHISDAYCSLATGAALTKRTLFSDADETCIIFKRPVILNGINNVATRADLADRMVPIHLAAISKKGRRSERALEAKFREMHPRVLGSLLTAVSAALRRRDQVKLDEAERMIDVLEWVTAAEPELGIEPGGFQRAYSARVQSASREALDASLVGSTVLEFMQAERDRGDLEWCGTCKALEATLRERLESDKPPKAWPRTPIGLSHALRRAAPVLRREGVDVVEPGEKDRPRNYTLRIESLPAPDAADNGRRGQPSAENGPSDHEKANPDASDASDGFLGLVGPASAVSLTAAPQGEAEDPGPGVVGKGADPAHRDRGAKTLPETVGSVGTVGTPPDEVKKAGSGPTVSPEQSSEPSVGTEREESTAHYRPAPAGALAPAPLGEGERRGDMNEEEAEWLG